MVPEMRVGTGYDVHRFAQGRPLVLGGVRIHHDRGLEGYSDADALLHAVMDALLGAAGLEDIGHHFPPGDERYKDISSLKLLAEVGALIATNQWVIANIDTTILAEEPRLAPHLPAMKRAIAETLGLAEGRIGIKATTNERLGFIGRGEGIAAIAVALLVQLEQ